MKTCFIVGAGEFFENSLAVKPGDLVIAADGGYLHLQKIGVIPDIIMGDFDSAEKPDFENIAVFNSEKDDTDTMLAVKLGFDRVVIPAWNKNSVKPIKGVKIDFVSSVSEAIELFK